MAKQILLVNGSPRKGGNTDLLSEAFIEGARSAGHKVEAFDIRDMNIGYCVGCGGGGGDLDSPCRVKDDMDKIYPVLARCDTVVLASPHYYYSITAQMKTFLDRTYAFFEASRPNRPHRDILLLLASAGSDFDPVRGYYEDVVKRIGWTDKGQLLASGVTMVGDAAHSPFLEKAKALGAAL